MNKNIKKNLDKTFTYPSTNDKNFLSKMYNKREFYYNKIDERPELKDYKKIKELRDDKCGNKRKGAFSHQALLSNFINPNTPYNIMRVILFDGLHGRPEEHAHVPFSYVDVAIRHLSNMRMVRGLQNERISPQQTALQGILEDILTQFENFITYKCIQKKQF